VCHVVTGVWVEILCGTAAARLMAGWSDRGADGHFLDPALVRETLRGALNSMLCLAGRLTDNGDIGTPDDHPGMEAKMVAFFMLSAAGNLLAGYMMYWAM